MMQVFSFIEWLTLAFVRFFSKKNNDTGLRDDPRTDEQKALDYVHEERTLAETGDPFNNQKIIESMYPRTDQHFTLACVPHAICLALAIERKNDTGIYQSLAAMFPYRFRSNYPTGGSYAQEIFGILANKGAPPLESLLTPTTEAEANQVVITDALRKEATLFTGKDYFTIEKPNDITTIARIAAQGHGVPICFYAMWSEWARAYPTVIMAGLTREDGAADVKHEVCVLPHSGFTENGIRYVAIQDSALYAGLHIRYLSEDFIAKRVFNAGYWDTVKVTGGGPRPHHTFTMTLTAGMSNPEVKQVQLLLISEGLLPSDCATGYLGGLTLAGIRAFQVRYKDVILAPQGLTAPTNRWGQGCIKQANILCA